MLTEWGKMIIFGICMKCPLVTMTTKCFFFTHYGEAFGWSRQFISLLLFFCVQIAVGRSTRDHTIDVNLNLEGPAAKVSRKQATIRLRNSGDFFMSSEGKRPIFVDGRPILQGNKVKLNHNSVIEVSINNSTNNNNWRVWMFVTQPYKRD